MGENITYFLLMVVSLYLLYRIYIRLVLSSAKHPSLRGHSRWFRRIVRLIPYIEYDASHFFESDGAPDEIITQRKRAVERLKQATCERSATTIAYYQSFSNDISDMQFTSAYRVPYPYRKHLPEEFKAGSIATKTAGVRINDMDDNWNYDLAGSYGVNVFGYDFYKQCMDTGFEMARNIGPVLGPYHPVIKDNVQRLKLISGLDEVSFHMSGTEAVMQAVRLARYHTGKSHLVRFCGAYHGWWDGAQPGIGNQRKTDDVYTLSDLSEKTLKVLRTRKDIACLLINPFQALHPNADASSDVVLISSDRCANYYREVYTKWLRKLRDICTERNIVLIFDEVFSGFRLAHRGAQEYFGVQADMVTYGKTSGGGLPVGVVCGRHDLMKRYRDDRPLDICFARGTFNSHPYVMCCMNAFLKRIETDAIQKIYATADELWNTRVISFNTMLEAYDLPVRVKNMHSVLTVTYKIPGRYNWMFQFYLRNEGLELSWTGTGRFIMSLNYSDHDFEAVTDRFVKAAEKMKADGWWWQSDGLTNRSIKRMMINDILKARFPIIDTLTRTSVFDEDEVLKGEQS